MKRLISVSLGLVLSTFISKANSWPQFRGEGGAATLKEAQAIPMDWSETTHLKWKTALPGPGSSSPVFWDDRIFVTCYVGYGTDPKEPGNPEDLGRQLLCLKRSSGKILWKRSIELKNPEDDYRGYIMEHGYASSSPVTDGVNVYAFVGKSGVHAFDMEGQPVWSKQVGKQSANRRWGSGASPILHADLLIVNAADEGRALIAFDKTTGEERWRKESKALELAYGTPVLRDQKDGSSELMIAMPGEVWSLSPLSGEVLWTVPTEMPGNVCPTMVTTSEMAFAFGGYPKKISLGIRDGKVVWTGKSTTYVPTPLEYDGHLYWVNDDAEAICMNAETGELVTKQKVEGLVGSKKRSFYASMVRAGDKLIAVSRKSGVFIFEASPEMKQVGQNRFEDSSDFNATPALAEDALYLRSNRFIYAVAK
ncbi:PQQ-binding-like beta-propeller repeat protein [Haloferula sp.]|uniref:outer membrane protein assembly factor BamB family protein n=1 Tax=Haloferula sp. TaxID=2497595 RepID=UPI00329CCFC4